MDIESQIKEIAEALDEGNIDRFRELLNQYPERILTHEGKDQWLALAAGDGLLDFVKHLVGLGVDVNVAPVQHDHTAVMSAASRGHLDVVRWLVEHGAKLNFVWEDGKISSPALTMAAADGHMEVLKYLIENGAAINATAPSGFTPLMAAKMRGKREAAEYLHAIGAKDARDLTSPDYEASHTRITEIMQELRGEVRELVLSNTPDGHIRLFSTQPSASDDSQTIFTIGLSDRNLRLPNGRVIATELSLRLPRDWPLDDNALRDERWSWPITALRTIAETTLRSQHWPDHAAVFFMNGDSTAPLTSSTKLCGWVALVPPGSQYQMPDFRWVEMRDLVAIYQEEKPLIEQRGHEEFVRRLHDADASLYLHLKRPNVADGL